MSYNIFDNFIFRIPVFTVDKTEKKVLNESILKEAIFLASKNLYDNISSENEATKLSVYKYLLRATFRCTPFGIFSGLGLGKFTDGSTEIDVRPNSFYTKTTLDTTVVAGIINKYILNSDVADNKYFINKTLYKVGDSYRYIEYNIENLRRKYLLSQIDTNEEIDAVISYFDNGNSVNNLKREYCIDEDTEIFIKELINNQILTPDISLSITGRENLDYLLRFSTDESLNKFLNNLKDSLDKIDCEEIGSRMELYDNITGMLNYQDIPLNDKSIFLTNLYVNPVTSTINNINKDLYMSGLKVLNTLSPSTNNRILEEFQKKFFERYEEQEIPLLEVFDNDMGLQLEGSYLNSKTNDDLISGVSFSRRDYNNFFYQTEIDMFLMEKYEDWIKSKKECIEITDKDIKKLPNVWDDLPNTMSTISEVIEIDKKTGEILLLKMESVAGSSAANLISRFSVDNCEVRQHIKSIIDIENKHTNEDELLAEIIHLPDDRLGNILQRFSFRDHEITFFARNSSEDVINIEPSDLYLSVKNGKKFVLKSKKLNKEIIPRLTSAHNFSRNPLPLYHFLCLLQSQHTRNSLFFSWGSVLSQKKYLPRVTYKRIVLSSACWNVNHLDYKKKFTYDMNGIAKFIDDYNLPEKFLFIDGDNKILIDTKSTESIKILISLIKNKDFKLEEFLFDKDFGSSLVVNEKSHYINQIIVSFYKSVHHA